jgi:hypothetical protein
MAEKVKVLCTGDVNGKFSTLFASVRLPPPPTPTSRARTKKEMPSCLVT